MRSPKMAFVFGAIVLFVIQVVTYLVNGLLPDVSSPVLILPKLAEGEMLSGPGGFLYYIVGIYLMWHFFLQSMRFCCTRLGVAKMDVGFAYVLGAGTLLFSQILVHCGAAFLPNVHAPVVLFLPLFDDGNFNFDLWASEMKFYVVELIVMMAFFILTPLLAAAWANKDDSAKKPTGKPSPA